MDRYDVIIIGTGAGGGTLAHAPRPHRQAHPAARARRLRPPGEGELGPAAVNVEGRYHTKEVWHDRDGKELHPHTNYYVGGNTKFYGAALFRFRREDFGELRHHGGVSPAWPIAYEELEPYYRRPSTSTGPRKPRRGPHRAAASAPYRHPAVSHEPRIQAAA